MVSDHEAAQYRQESYPRRGERLAIPAILLALLLLAGLTVLLPEGREEVPTELAYLYAAAEVHERTAVGGLIDIEDAWAIEDERQEAQAPLVRSMFNGDSALGYDAESDTFYCTLGVEHKDDWPELALSVEDAPGVTVVWIDDYAYDFCADAVREGYRYELLAYTDTEYAYFGMVFTGLPIITWHTYDETEPIGDEYVQGCASVSSAQHEAVNSAAQIHLRGGSFPLPMDKPSYRLEFHELSRKGRDRSSDHAVLGMEPDSDWLLLGVAWDRSTLINHLCWRMWDAWNEGEPVPMQMGSEMIELFVNDEYRGIYELMPCIRVEKEIERVGGNLGTDCVARALVRKDDNYEACGRPMIDFRDSISTMLEVRWAPEYFSEARVQHLFEAYEQLNLSGEQALSDEAFTGLAQSVVDTRQAMSYFLFFHVCRMTRENLFNNRYIWMLRKDDGYRMMITPWDMDHAMNNTYEIVNEGIIYLGLTMEERMLDLNVDGCRDILWSIWEEKKETLLTETALYAWIRGEEAYINASGAYLRESEKWYGEAEELNLSEMYEEELSYIGLIDSYLRELWPSSEMVAAKAQ